MKDQYFGDVNDFRKYGLLRALERASHLALGVCWFLTPDDGGADGQLRRYLSAPSRWRHHDPALYDKLQRLARADIQPSVSLAREWDLIPEATYFGGLVPDNRPGRLAYIGEARRALGHCDLVFVDPDNGIEVPSTSFGARGSSKYVYWSELQALYAQGHSLLIYQHYPRVVRERFVPFLTDRLVERLPGSTVVAFSTPYVVFLLAHQPRHSAALGAAVDPVRRQWSGQIAVWSGPVSGPTQQRPAGADGGLP
jgi:hypothetical protein